MAEEKVLVLNMRKLLVEKPRWKRTTTATRILRKFLERKLKTDKIKIDSELNRFIWSRGAKNPPMKIRVRAAKEGEVFKVYLVK